MRPPGSGATAAASSRRRSRVSAQRAQRGAGRAVRGGRRHHAGAQLADHPLCDVGVVGGVRHVEVLERQVAPQGLIVVTRDAGASHHEVGIGVSLDRLREPRRRAGRRRTGQYGLRRHGGHREQDAEPAGPATRALMDTRACVTVCPVSPRIQAQVRPRPAGAADRWRSTGQVVAPTDGHVRRPALAHRRRDPRASSDSAAENETRRPVGTSKVTRDSTQRGARMASLSSLSARGTPCPS